MDIQKFKTGIGRVIGREKATISLLIVKGNDYKMAERNNEDDAVRKKISDYIDKAIAKYKKNATEEIHLLILRKWRNYAGIAVALFVIILEVYFGFLNRLPVDPVKVQSLATTLFEASVTVIGILIGIFPVVSFFASDQMEKRGKPTENYDSDNELLQKAKQFFGAEYTKKLDSFEKLVYVMYHNFKIGVLRYTATYLKISISLLLALIFLYVSLDPIYFIPIDVSILIIVLFGVLPILTILTGFENYLDIDTTLNPEKIVDNL